MNQPALQAESFSALASGLLPQRPFDIHLSAEIAAARPSLFYALTLPEYLEAWLHMPDTTGLRVTLSNDPAELRLDRYCTLRHIGTIFVRFNVRSKDSIRLSWRNCTGLNTSWTSVRVILRGKRRHCMLHLTHSGFRTEQERRWHHTMWANSLTDLSRLMSR